MAESVYNGEIAYIKVQKTASEATVVRVFEDKNTALVNADNGSCFTMCLGEENGEKKIFYAPTSNNNEDKTAVIAAMDGNGNIRYMLPTVSQAAGKDLVATLWSTIKTTTTINPENQEDPYIFLNGGYVILYGGKGSSGSAGTSGKPGSAGSGGAGGKCVYASYIDYYGNKDKGEAYAYGGGGGGGGGASGYTYNEKETSSSSGYNYSYNTSTTTTTTAGTAGKGGSGGKGGQVRLDFPSNIMQLYIEIGCIDGEGNDSGKSGNGSAGSAGKSASGNDGGSGKTTSSSGKTTVYYGGKGGAGGASGGGTGATSAGSAGSTTSATGGTGGAGGGGGYYSSDSSSKDYSVTGGALNDNEAYADVYIYI